MNRKEIEKNIKWDSIGIGTVNIQIPLFNKEVTFEIFTENSEISDKAFVIIEDIINLPILPSIEKIKNLLWEDCNFMFTVADYGCEPKKDETTKEAHFREFGLKNKKDAFNKSFLKSIRIDDENNELNGRYAEIVIDSATDNLVSIIVKNGTIIDYDYENDQLILEWWETDEQYAYKLRKKILNEEHN